MLRVRDVMLLTLLLLAWGVGAQGTQLLCGSATRVGRRVRQEDVSLLTTLSSASCPPLRLACVFDGHEGAAAARFAAAELPGALRAGLDGCEGEHWQPAVLASSLSAALVSVDTALLARGISPDGTTVVAALVLPPTNGSQSSALVLAHVGDSRAYICRAEGAQLLTSDHAPGDPSERARLLAAGGTVTRTPGGRWRLNGELAVSRALGDAPYRQSGLISQPDVSFDAHLAPGDMLLLLSDGALEAMTAEALCSAALSDAQAAPAAQLQPIPLLGERGEAPAPRSGDFADDTEEGASGVAVRVANAALAAGSSDNVAVVACTMADRSNAPLAKVVVAGSRGRYLLTTAIAVRRPLPLLLYEEGEEFSPAPWAARELGECSWLPEASGGSGMQAIDAGGWERASICVLRALLQLPGGSAQDGPSPSPSPSPSPLDEEGRRFRVGSAAGHGHYGEVFRALRVGDPGGTRYVVKRVPAGPGPRLRAAQREAHFGAVLPGSLLVESFQSDDGFWLVFRDGGASLDALMYSDQGPNTAATAGSTPLALVAPSRWWLSQRAAGGARLRDIWRAVLSSLVEAHAAGVAHRDIKPGNVLVQEGAGGLLSVQLCDWGSAVDEASLAALYGQEGPTAAEETADYAPPEARFGGAAWHGRHSQDSLQAYDVWSAGILGLELFLGTADVFALSPADLAAARRSAAGAGLGADATELLLALKRLAGWCIAPLAPGGKASMATQRCGEAALAAALRAQDPLGQGVDIWALRLLRRMLSWDASQRLSAARVLQHAFFAAQPGRGVLCAQGREAEWADECGG